MELLDVGMIKRRGKNACNDPALLRDAQTLVGAKAFDWAGICGGIATIFHLFGLSCGQRSYRTFRINRSYNTRGTRLKFRPAVP